MKKRFLIIVAAVLFAAVDVFAEDFHPKASEKAVIVCGNARFTVLTERLVRMEWSEDGVFEDNATLGIVNRDLPVPAFSVVRSKNSVKIVTKGLTLKYKGPAKFDENNLSVTFQLNGKNRTWHPGMSDEGNLLGTARTLDKFDGDKTMDPYDKGVVSRDGWAVIDESTRHILVPVEADWKYWVGERPAGDRQDLYMFAYGHDYTAAVSDFTKVAGRIPLPPKYAFGYWWCRYWMYSDTEVRDIIKHFNAFNMPMDVFIIDMDWHYTWGYGKNNKVKDEAGQRLGWTGYTWDTNLFPDPDRLLHEMLDSKIQTSLNLHPASGLIPLEEPYERFRADYLSRTNDYDGPKNYVDSTGRNVYIPFRMSQMEWADAYFNSVIRPLEKQGVSFWWLDWQQYRQSRYVKDLSNTFWLNYTFWNDMARQSASQGKSAPRPMIYHRWGGIGSHRYQVGFSGDTYATWKVLGALPYFTYTASNVGYCYWGHDIGGHMQPKGVKSTDPELYTRWMQSGVFTPIFKSHSTKDMTMEKRFWMFPTHFDAMRESIRLRYDLAPYIYTAAREAYDSGLGLSRPLYYVFPEDEQAYTTKEEFFFGPDVLATTVCTPVDKTTGLAPRSMWFTPDADWFDMATGRMYLAGTCDTLKYTIDENPWFVRAGAVIPMSGSDIMNLQSGDNELRLRVVPGMGSFETSVYEDDGRTQAYATDFATTAIRKVTSGDCVKVSVAPRKGSFEGAPASRRVTVELECASAPSKVTLNGSELAWKYDGENLRVIVQAPETSVDQALEFEIYSTFCFTSGEKAVIRRMLRLSEEGKMAYCKASSNADVPFEFVKYSNAAGIVSARPSEAEAIIRALKVEDLKGEFEKYPKLNPDFVTKVLEQLAVYAR